MTRRKKLAPVPSPFVVPNDLAEMNFTLPELRQIVAGRETIRKIRERRDASPHKDLFDSLNELHKLQDEINAIVQAEGDLIKAVVTDARRENLRA